MGERVISRREFLRMTAAATAAFLLGSELPAANRPTPLNEFWQKNPWRLPAETSKIELYQAAKLLSELLKNKLPNNKRAGQLFGQVEYLKEEEIAIRMRGGVSSEGINFTQAPFVLQEEVHNDGGTKSVLFNLSFEGYLKAKETQISPQLLFLYELLRAQLYLLPPIRRISPQNPLSLSLREIFPKTDIDLTIQWVDGFSLITPKPLRILENLNDSVVDLLTHHLLQEQGINLQIGKIATDKILPTRTAFEKIRRVLKLSNNTILELYSNSNIEQLISLTGMQPPARGLLLLLAADGENFQLINYLLGFRVKYA